MPMYRLKILGDEYGDQEERILEYLNDDAALDDLAFIAHPGQIELWAGERLVGRFLGLPGAPD